EVTYLVLVNRLRVVIGLLPQGARVAEQDPVIPPASDELHILSKGCMAPSTIAAGAPSRDGMRMDACLEQGLVEPAHGWIEEALVEQKLGGSQVVLGLGLHAKDKAVEPPRWLPASETCITSGGKQAAYPPSA